MIMIIITVTIAKIIFRMHALLINQIVNSLSTDKVKNTKKMNRKVAIDQIYDVENPNKLIKNGFCSIFQSLRDKIGMRSLCFVAVNVTFFFY